MDVLFPREKSSGTRVAVDSTRRYVCHVAETLTPALTAGLVALCRAKPTNPAEFLAHYLLENNRRAA